AGVSRRAWLPSLHGCKRPSSAINPARGQVGFLEVGERAMDRIRLSARGRRPEPSRGAEEGFEKDMVAPQELARALAEEKTHGAVEVGLVIETGLERDLGQRRGVIEVEQRHDPVDLQDLPEEFRTNADDVGEAPV